MWGLMIARAISLQILPNDRFKALQKRQFETVVTLNPRRGDILDRNNHELAISMPSYALFADPKILEEPKKVARILAHELHVPFKSIEEKLRQRRKRFVWIERKLSKAVRDSIDSLRIRGLGFIEESKRVYPNERLLSQVIGFVGGEGQGLEGLEQWYNEQLQAESKKVSVHRDARGRPLIVNGQIFNQVPDGFDVQLTVDRELQFILEQELTGAVREHEADSAVGVILDAQTSEVLAMASSPTFDPNRALDFSPDRRRNRAVTDSFEPGSTMKTFLIAGAMAKGLIEPNTKFDCEGGSMRIGKRVVREAEAREKYELLTVSEILAHSSNIGVTKIALKLGDTEVKEAMTLFGFGEKTGVDLPGEAKGIIQPLPWHDHLLSNISFGQGITATPLQIANAYAAIANGGFLRQPFIVRAVRDHETGEISETRPYTLRRVLTGEQVAKMRIMLNGVTSENGTGTAARVPGFPVAGKTGTAQKVNPEGRGYISGGYISSFAGFLPTNDPKFVIYVVVDRPRKGYYGAAVAAPLFSRVAKFAVRRAGLAPVLINEDNVVPQARREVVPERPAQRSIEEFSKNRAGDEVEVSATQIQANSEVALEVVPDLMGLTLREVLGRISSTGVILRVHGHGFVTRTLPAQGVRFAERKEFDVYLE
jgi:cell division protein FtsI (penicillin-binding protein 3)